MSEFFKRTEVPQAQRVQSASPRGNTTDRQAHLDAQESQGGLGGAIHNLLGLAGQIKQDMNKMDEEDRRQMEKKFALKADASVSDFGKYSKNFISSKAAEEGKNIEDYTDDEIDSFENELKSSFIDSRGLRDKEYFSLINSRLNDKGTLLIGEQKRQIKNINNKKSMDSLFQTVSSNFTHMEPESFVDYLESTLDTSVGPDAEIQETREDVKEAMLGRLMTSAMENNIGDPKTIKGPEMVAKLESKEMRDFFNMPEYDNVLNMAKQQAQSTINKRRTLNFESMSDQGFFMATNGGFSSHAEVDKFIKSQQFKEGYDPSPKDIARLSASLKKTVDTEINYQEYSEALKSGDFNFTERKAMKKKDREALEEKLWATETGMTDSSSLGQISSILLGESEGAIKDYSMRGLPYPRSLISTFNSPVTGSIENIKSKTSGIYGDGIVDTG